MIDCRRDFTGGSQSSAALPLSLAGHSAECWATEIIIHKNEFNPAGQERGWGRGAGGTGGAVGG